MSKVKYSKSGGLVAPPDTTCSQCGGAARGKMAAVVHFVITVVVIGLICLGGWTVLHRLME